MPPDPTTQQANWSIVFWVDMAVIALLILGEAWRWWPRIKLWFLKIWNEVQDNDT